MRFPQQATPRAPPHLPREVGGRGQAQQHQVLDEGHKGGVEHEEQQRVDAGAQVGPPAGGQGAQPSAWSRSSPAGLRRLLLRLPGRPRSRQRCPPHSPMPPAWPAPLHAAAGAHPGPAPVVLGADGVAALASKVVGEAPAPHADQRRHEQQARVQRHAGVRQPVVQREVPAGRRRRRWRQRLGCRPPGCTLHAPPGCCSLGTPALHAPSGAGSQQPQQRGLTRGSKSAQETTACPPAAREAGTADGRAAWAQ